MTADRTTSATVPQLLLFRFFPPPPWVSRSLFFKQRSWWKDLLPPLWVWWPPIQLGPCRLLWVVVFLKEKKTLSISIRKDTHSLEDILIVMWMLAIVACNYLHSITNYTFTVFHYFPIRIKLLWISFKKKIKDAFIFVNLLCFF